MIPNVKKLRDEILALMESEDYSISFDDIVDDIQKNCILFLMNRFNNNKASVAKYMGINRTTLVERMRHMNFRLNPPNKIQIFPVDEANGSNLKELTEENKQCHTRF